MDRLDILVALILGLVFLSALLVALRGFKVIRLSWWLVPVPALIGWTLAARIGWPLAIYVVLTLVCLVMGFRQRPFKERYPSL